MTICLEMTIIDTSKSGSTALESGVGVVLVQANNKKPFQFTQRINKTWIGDIAGYKEQVSIL